MKFPPKKRSNLMPSAVEPRISACAENKLEPRLIRLMICINTDARSSHYSTGTRGPLFLTPCVSSTKSRCGCRYSSTPSLTCFKVPPPQASVRSRARAISNLEARASERREQERDMERGVPVRKTHASTAGLLAWSEEGSAAASATPPRAADSR